MRFTLQSKTKRQNTFEILTVFNKQILVNFLKPKYAVLNYCRPLKLISEVILQGNKTLENVYF